MGLIRDIDQDPVKQAVLKGILTVCQQLNTKVLAEGIESKAELDYLWAQGIQWFQGYYFARPALEQLIQKDQIAVWS